MRSGGFSSTFSPYIHTKDFLVSFVEEALDASGGLIGGILAELLPRACPKPVAADDLRYHSMQGMLNSMIQTNVLTTDNVVIIRMSLLGCSSLRTVLTWMIP